MVSLKWGRLFEKPSDLPVFFCWNFGGAGRLMVLSTFIPGDLKQKPFLCSSCFVRLGQRSVCVSSEQLQHPSAAILGNSVNFARSFLTHLPTKGDLR